jgi:ribose-phosphate pyrophosphokinase
MVDTAGTLCQAADALIKFGAKKVVAYATHPVLSGPAVERITNTDIELVVSDTIPLSPEARSCDSIRQLSMAGILAEAMRRVSNEESISAMFR